MSIFRAAAAAVVAGAIIVAGPLAGASASSHRAHDPMKGNRIAATAATCAHEEDGTASVEYRVHSDDTRFFIDGQFRERVDAGAHTIEVGGLSAGTHRLQLGDEAGKRGKFDDDDPFTFVDIPQCQKPKTYVTAPTIEVGCGYVIIPSAPFIGYEALVGGNWTVVTPGKHDFPGEIIQIRPYVTADVVLTNPGIMLYGLAGDECIEPLAPKMKVTAPIVKVGCGTVVIARDQRLVFTRLLDGKWVALKTGVNRVAGTSIVVRPFLVDGTNYELTNPGAKQYNLRAACPKVQYITESVQVDQCKPETAAQAKLLARLDNDGVLRYREDKPLWGHCIYTTVKTKVAVGASWASKVKAVNGQIKANNAKVAPTKRIGLVRLGGHLVGAKVGSVYVTAWVLAPGATANAPWGTRPTPAENAQRFLARG